MTLHTWYPVGRGSLHRRIFPVLVDKFDSTLGTSSVLPTTLSNSSDFWSGFNDFIT